MTDKIYSVDNIGRNDHDIIKKCCIHQKEILANRYVFNVNTIADISQVTCVIHRMICAFFIAVLGVLGFYKYRIVYVVINGLQRCSHLPVPSRWQGIPVYPVKPCTGCSPGCLVCFYAFGILSD